MIFNVHSERKINRLTHHKYIKRIYREINLSFHINGFALVSLQDKFVYFEKDQNNAP